MSTIDPTSSVMCRLFRRVEQAFIRVFIFGLHLALALPNDLRGNKPLQWCLHAKRINSLSSEATR